MGFAKVGPEVGWPEVAFAVDTIAAWLWAIKVGFVVDSAHVFDPFF